jgi:hypothetical protein
MKKHTIPRRHFLAAASSLALAYARPVMAIATEEEKAGVSVISKRTQKVFRAPCKQPNALQAVADGLWILDQVDDPGNMVYKVTYDGKVLKQFPTESIHGSGITVGKDGALWVGSTWGLKTLKLDPNTGTTLAAFETHFRIDPSDGARNQQDRAQHSRSRLADTRPRLGGWLSMVRHDRRECDLQNGSRKRQAVGQDSTG